MFQKRHAVKVKDKLTRKEYELTVAGQPDAESAKRHVAQMPGAAGGRHPGFEVLDAVEVDDEGKPVPPEQPAAQ